MNKKETLEKMGRGRFVKNNGLLLRMVNILTKDYEKLSDVRYARDDIPEEEYIDSLNYIFESGYIKLRHIKTKKSVEISDYDIDELEAKLTQKGVQLLRGVISDELVEV